MGGSVVLLSKYGRADSISFDASGNLVKTVNGADTLVTNEDALQSTEKTIATTSVTTFNLIAPFAGILTSVDFSGKDALAASDTNYILFTGVNKGQAGAGTNALLLATAANGTQVTGGTALAALTKRVLALNATAANLIIAKGDRLQVLATVTGTLANTVTESLVEMRFTQSS